MSRANKTSKDKLSGLDLQSIPEYFGVKSRMRAYQCVRNHNIYFTTRQIGMQGRPVNLYTVDTLKEIERLMDEGEAALYEDQPVGVLTQDQICQKFNLKAYQVSFLFSMLRVKSDGKFKKRGSRIRVKYHSEEKVSFIMSRIAKILEEVETWNT